MKITDLTILIEKNKKLKEEVEIKLYEVNTELKKEQDILKQLEGYKIDYWNKLEEKKNDSIHMAIYRSYTDFIDSVVKNINLINNKIRVTEEQKVKIVKELSTINQKMLAFETLLKKENKKTIIKENRKEQKLYDELSLINYRKKALKY